MMNGFTFEKQSRQSKFDPRTSKLAVLKIFCKFLLPKIKSYCPGTTAS